MPDRDDDFEARLTTLEREVARLRAQTVLIGSDAAVARVDAAAARMLTAGADRDVAEVRAELQAQAQALNAVRETQVERTREVREGFAQQAIGMDEITALLTKLAEQGGNRPG